jgi:hypothetical protein
MTFDIKIPWKTFRIHLGRVQSAFKTLGGPDYRGMSTSDKELILHFSGKPYQSFEMKIIEHWNSLTEEGEKAKFIQDRKEQAAISEATRNLPLLDPNTLIAAERKLLLKMPLSLDDRKAILDKYPQ